MKWQADVTRPREKTLQETIEEMHGGFKDCERMDDNNTSFIVRDELSYLMMLDAAKDVVRDHSIPIAVRVHYSKIINWADKEIEKNGGHIDVSKAAVRKSYLGLKKLVKRKAEAPITCKKGCFDENSPLVGVDADSHARLQKVYRDEPAYQTFVKELYDSSDARFHMIPERDRAKADQIAQEMLDKELDKYGLKAEDVFNDPIDFRNVTNCYSIDNEWNDWKLQVILSTGGLGGDGYCPMGVIALHELGHVKSTMPGVSQKQFHENQGEELAPTIDLIVRQDEIYKKIHHIALDKVVSYPKPLVLGGQEVNLGELANKFRQIKEKYGYDSYEDVLLTKEARNYICLLENSKDKKHSMFKNRNISQEGRS